MNDPKPGSEREAHWPRRRFLKGALAGGALATGGAALYAGRRAWTGRAETLIARADSYDDSVAATIFDALASLGVHEAEIKGKKILLKPNLVESLPGALHINTHPIVVRAAAEAFARLGAASVVVAEGPGHRRDTLLVLEESGLGDALYEDRIPFVDLNYESVRTVKNLGGRTKLKTLTLPALLADVDWIVSLAKMKTHHWVGATLSMKNLFGLMPGSYYGWPKNVLHWAGIADSILDINATVKPDFAIVDGIVGMEGDGPIMGRPRPAGVLVFGRNLPAVDATCARVMGIDPLRLGYLVEASGWLGPIAEARIDQRGESIDSLRTDFALLPAIPAHRDLRLL